MRDYCAEMAGEIDAATSGGSYVPRVVADEIVDKLRATDPDLLAGWLDAQAGQFVWQTINNRDRSTRARTRSQVKRQAFKGAVADHAKGEQAPLRRFLDMPIPTESGVTCSLGSLSRPDLDFAANRYQRLADDNLMMASFLRALAKKVGKQTVSDHYSEEQLAAMFGSLRSAA